MKIILGIILFLLFVVVAVFIRNATTNANIDKIIESEYQRRQKLHDNGTV